MAYRLRDAALGALCLIFAAIPGVVDAHSKDEVTTPPENAVLDESPEVIGMNFDMPMRITLITLTDEAGETHELVRTDNLEPVTKFEATPPASLPNGAYRIDWRGLSSDGHPMVGDFSFTIRR